jgi:hypothetical protein
LHPEEESMKFAIALCALLLLSACGESVPQLRFSDCRAVAERVALDATDPESISALSIFADESEKTAAREEARRELETQRAGFMTASHEQRMVLALTKGNRFAERYTSAYAKCREIDAGRD